MDKYNISKTLYNPSASCLYAHMNTQAQDFIDRISGPSSLYGLRQETLQSETLDSLVLSLLTHGYELAEPRVMNNSLDLKLFLMQELLQNLCRSAGLHIPLVSTTRLITAKKIVLLL